MSKENDSVQDALVTILFMTVIFLNLAVDRNVSPREIDKANEICKNANSSLEKMNVGSLYVDVTCKNSGEFRFGAIQTEEK